MLNPRWNTYDWKKDLATWQKLNNLISDEYRFTPGSFFEEYEKQIADLYDKYYRTNAGGGTDPNRATRQKFVIMQKHNVFGDLENAVAEAERAESDKWSENQLRDESLDAKLEREEEMYRNKKENTFAAFSVRISARHKI